MISKRTRYEQRRKEHGAVAIIVAISMVMLLVASALVLDFAVVRLDRQQNKSAADAAASAGMRAGDVGLGRLYTDLAVCGALAFLKANQPALSSLPNDFCTSPNPGKYCKPSDTTTHSAYAATITSGRKTYTVSIKAPYKVSDGAFPEEALGTLVNDAEASGKGGCDQVGVIVTQKSKPGFGSLATNSDLVTRIRSVGRVGVSQGKVAVALLLLERTGCTVVKVGTSGPGTGAMIRVLGSATQAGMIHADSDGSTCGSGEQIFVGNQDHGIVSYASQDELVPGQISSVAGTVPRDIALIRDDVNYVYSSSAKDPAGALAKPRIEVKPVAPITRSVVDDRYWNGVKSAMLYARNRWSTPPPESVPSVVWVSGGACTGPSGPGAAAEAAAIVVFNCSQAGKNYPANTTLAATEVIFLGTLYVSNPLLMPNATEVYVRGSASGDDAITLHSKLSIHTEPSQLEYNSALGKMACKENYRHASRARLVVGGGGINGNNTAAVAQMCHTSVLMMGNNHSDDRPGCIPAVATVDNPPESNACDGFVSFNGGDQDWTAPNAEAGPPVGADETWHPDWDNLEDLALWSEAEEAGVQIPANFSIGGNGTMHLAGVFMAPNANPMDIGGTGAQYTKNAQFIVRRLRTHGGGQFDMQPDPADVVTPPMLDGFELVR